MSQSDVKYTLLLQAYNSVLLNLAYTYVNEKQDDKDWYELQKNTLKDAFYSIVTLRRIQRKAERAARKLMGKQREEIMSGVYRYDSDEA